MGRRAEIGAAGHRRIAVMRGRIERWRRGRLRHEAMPEELWEAATELAREHGASRVAGELGLGYRKLRDRVEQASATPNRRLAHANGFVELAGADLLAQRPSMGTELEVRDADGATLLIRIGAGEKLDVVGVVGAFRGGRS